MRRCRKKENLRGKDLMEKEEFCLIDGALLLSWFGEGSTHERIGKRIGVNNDDKPSSITSGGIKEIKGNCIYIVLTVRQ